MSEYIVELDDETDRWKWTCPRGHRTWEPTNHHFWCHECARQHSVDGTFGALHNVATDETVERDRIRLMTPAGPYSTEGSA
jgi:hypothetical protein